MIGQDSPTARRVGDRGPGRGSTAIAPRESRDAIARPPRHARGRRRRMPRASAQRRRTFALFAEHLEGRSVPSGFGDVSLSALSSAVQSAVHPAMGLAHDVVSPSDLGRPTVAPASTATALIFPVEGTVAAAPGVLLGAADSVAALVDAAPTPVMPPADVSPGTQTTRAGVADADATGTSPSSEVSVTQAVSVALPSIVPIVSNLAADLVGALDDVLAPLDGGAAAGSPGGGAGGGDAGLSIAAGPGLGGSDISASASGLGVALTLPGLSVEVETSLSPSDPTDESPVPSPPSGPTPPASPGDPVENPTTPSHPIGSPTVPGDPAGNPSTPTSGGGSTAPTLAASGSTEAGATTGGGHARSTGSTWGGPAEADDGAGGAQSGGFVPNGGSAASPVLLGAAAAHEPASSTSPSIPATVSGPVNSGAVVGRGGLEDGPNRAGSPSADAEGSAGPEMLAAELSPGDLEGLEHALAQLMRQFDGVGEDLAGWIARWGMLEGLVGAGLAVLAGEVFRRWGCRRRVAIPRTEVGFSGRPGPFYRPRADPIGRPGLVGW